MVFEECGLGSVRSQIIDTLSRGYRQRVGLAQAIIHDPAILVLDEPTTGLDPRQIIWIRDLIKRLGKTKTVLLSTHILQEVESVCERVLILNEGSLVAQGKADDIADTLRPDVSVSLVVKGLNGTVPEHSLSRVDAVKSIHDTKYMEDDVISLELVMEPVPHPGTILFDWAVENHYKIVSLVPHQPGLEELFLSYFEQERSTDA